MSNAGRGDSQLLSCRRGSTRPAQVPGLLRALLVALEADRLTRDDGPPLRLRIAMGQGIVHRAATGFVGVAVVDVCRLVDAEPVRAELRDVVDADMCLVVTEDLYRDTIVQGYGGFPSDGFRQVSVIDDAKGFVAAAWMRALNAAALGPDPMVVGAVAASLGFSVRAAAHRAGARG